MWQSTVWRDRRPPPRRCRAPGARGGTSRAGGPSAAGRCAPEPARRRAATFSSAAVKSAETPISPIRPIRTPVPSTPSVASRHDLVGDRVRAHARDRRRMRALEIVAGAHDDLQAGRRADPHQRLRVAADAAAGRVDHRPPAQRARTAESSSTAACGSSSAQLSRLTNGSMRSSPRISIRTGPSARCRRSASAGRCHQQRQSLRICSCDQRDAERIGRDRAAHGHHLARADAGLAPVALVVMASAPPQGAGAGKGAC